MQVINIETMKTIINIEGMTCGHCVKSVKEIILEIEGVKSAEVSLDSANAEIEFEEVKIENIIEEINDSQFVASKIN